MGADAAKVCCRELRSEIQRVYHLTLSATVDDAYQRLLHTAALLVAELDPCAVFVDGVHWFESEDEYRLIVRVESPAQELSQVEIGDLHDSDMTIDCTFGVTT